jgi:hypothetical protein
LHGVATERGAADSQHHCDNAEDATSFIAKSGLVQMSFEHIERNADPHDWMTNRAI